MPILIVLGMPPGTPGLEQLIVNLQQAVIGVDELQLTTPQQVRVWFPSDLVTEDLGHELNVLVFGLLKKTKRTKSVIEKMSEAIAGCLWRFANVNLPLCKLIEVIPYSINEKDVVARR